MSSTHESRDKKTIQNASNCTSADAKSAILEATSEWIRRGELRRKIVDEKRVCCTTTFNTCMTELVADKRLERKPKTASSDKVSYRVMRQEQGQDTRIGKSTGHSTQDAPAETTVKDEPGLSSEEPAGSATQVTADKPGRERTFLVDHVMKTAHRILDEISECNWEKSEMLAISRKSLILENEVMKLSKFYPALPSWIEKDVKRAMDCIDFSKAVGEKHPKLRPRPPVTEMIDWQDHWIDVLRVLEGP